MKGTLTWSDTIRKRRPLQLTAVAVAALAAVIAIAVAVAVATGGASTKQTQRPAQTRDRIAACAPDDTRPIGPGGEGVPACLSTP